LKKKIIVIGLLCMLLIGLSGFGAMAVETPPPDDEGGVVRVSNWGLYMDQSIFEDFYQEYGIRVIYSEFQSNEELYSILRLGGATFDVIFPSDYMIARMIEEDMLAELNFDNIPNFSLIDPRYKNLDFDPENRFSVAYKVGTVVLIYNHTMVPFEVNSWGALFDERLAGQILMFDNSRDAFAIALLYLGYCINTTDEGELHRAFDLLVEQRSILQAYVMDQIFDKLESGEAAIGPYYAGDFLTMHANNPDLRFARPVEGTNYFVDAMVIPINAENQRNGELFINFVARTDIALRNMEYVRYASANYEAAAIFAAQLDELAYSVIFADDETLANAEVFLHLPQHILELYDELWIRLKADETNNLMVILFIASAVVITAVVVIIVLRKKFRKYD